jgi:hypothetical protein
MAETESRDQFQIGREAPRRRRRWMGSRVAITQAAGRRAGITHS